MKQSSSKTEPNSFAETVQLVENYVKQEIIQQTRNKQLFYHTIDHSLAVKRRASTIFRAIESVLPQDRVPLDSHRLKRLIDVSAMAHDLVQQFTNSDEASQPRKRSPGISEIASVDKLTDYIQQLNQRLSKLGVDDSILFGDLDLAIIKDGILATICDRDPQAGRADYSFSPYSIYQPYLYNSQPKISIVGDIIALADLGALGMEGVEAFLREGILVFLEDNLDLKDLIINCDVNCDCCDLPTQARIKTRLLNMSRFIVSLAQERYARFELEIAGFAPEARQILRSQVFIHFNQKNIAKIKAIVPTNENTSFTELINFFCLDNNIDLKSNK